ncbi:MAG: transglutaminase domain-containing protein [Candidatus Korarchaeota archaeon]
MQRGKGLSSHFASAYVATLRYFGVSARVVNGFTGGEWNGTHYVVKAKHIHYWAEVYVPVDSNNGNWIEFDCTPIVSDSTPLLDNYPPMGGGDPYVQTLKMSFYVSSNVTVVSRNDPVLLYAGLMLNGIPLQDCVVNFEDYTEGPLGSNSTNTSGYAGIVISYTSANISGNHTIIANFLSYYNITFVGVNGSSAVYIEVPSSVIRENGINVNGYIYDPDTSPQRRFSNMHVDIYIDDVLSGVTQTNQYGSYSARLSLDSLDVGVHTIKVVCPGIEGLVASSENMSDTIVNTTTIINVVLSPNRARLNSTVWINGTVTFGNATLVGDTDGSLEIRWRWANGTEELIATLTNLNNGGFNISKDILIDDCVGNANVSFNYTHTSPYVIPTFTYRIINIFDGGMIYISVNTTQFQHNQSILIEGHIENLRGEPVPNFHFAIFFNTSSVGYRIIETNTLNDGTYSLVLVIPTHDLNNRYIPPGFYNISAYGANSTLVCESIYLESVLQTRVFATIVPNSTQIFINESVLLRGRITDDYGVTIPANTWINITGNSFNERVEVLNGLFNLTLNGTNFTMGINNIGYIFNDQTEILISNTGIVNGVLIVFDSCNITIRAPREASPGAQITFEIVVEAYMTPIENRNISISINGEPVYTGITDKNGIVRNTYILPSEIEYDVLTVRVMVMITGNIESYTINIVRFNLMSFSLNYIVLPTVIGAIILVSIMLVVKRSGKKKASPTFSPEGLIQNIRALVSNEQYKEAVILLYQKMEMLLRVGKNLPITPATTARETANLAARNGLPAEALERLIVVFEMARYSNNKITQELFKVALQGFSEIYRHVTGGEFSIG